MIRVILATFLALPVLAGRLCLAADPPENSAGLIVLRNCNVDYSRTTLLASPQAGVLQECLVRPGDEVKAGQVLGRLQDAELRAEVERSRLVARSDTSVRASQARYDRSVAKLRASEILHRKRFLSDEELNLDRLDMEMMKIAIEEAKQGRVISGLQLQQVEALLRYRQFVSPHDGIVVDVMKNEGESAALNESLFRIVNTDRMRVSGSLDVGDAWRVQKGQRVRVWPEVEGADVDVERESFSGIVVFVDRRIDSEVQTCRVVAEVDNRDQNLRSGLHARMEILPRSPAGSAPGARPVTGSRTPPPATAVANPTKGG